MGLRLACMGLRLGCMGLRLGCMGLRLGCMGLQPRVHRVEGCRLAEEGADHPVHRLVLGAEAEHAVDEIKGDLLSQDGARAHLVVSGLGLRQRPRIG